MLQQFGFLFPTVHLFHEQLYFPKLFVIFKTICKLLLALILSVYFIITRKIGVL